VSRICNGARFTARGCALRKLARSLGPVRVSERAGIIAAIGFLVFGTPLRALWSHAAAPWWTPFALWALLIAAIAINVRRGER